MASVETGRLRSMGSRTATTLSNLLSLLALPGVAVHELGHAAACRLLGIEVQRVVLYRWPADFTRDRNGGGFVQHEPADSTWKSALVGTAPLVTNTAASLACLELAGRLFERAGPASADVPLGATVPYVSARLSALGPGRTAAVLVLTWVGLALAFTGFPSRRDFRNLGGFLDRVWGVADSSRSVWYALEHVHYELSTFYTLAVSVVGLFGLRTLLAVPVGEFLNYVLIGLAFLAVRVTRSEFDRVPGGKRDRRNRTRRLSRRASDGDRLDADEVTFLVETLSESNQTLREDAARALGRVARHHPETLREWESEILDRAESDRSSTVRRRLIDVVYDAYDELERTERTASLGVDALADDEFDEATNAPALVTRAAQDTPAALLDRLDEIERATSSVSPAQHGNLLYAAALVSTADATDTDDTASVTTHESLPGDPDRAQTGGERAAVLSSLPEPARGVTERLFHSLDDTTPVRSSALTGLGVVGAARPETAPALAAVFERSLDDEADAIRSAATGAIARIAEANPDALTDVQDDIIELLRDEDDAVRSSAALALARLADDAPDSVGSVDSFVERLADDHGNVRSNAALALWKLADVDPRRVGESVDAVVALLDDPVDSARSNALGVLSAVAEERPDLVARHIDDVLSATRDGSLAERVNATSVLATLAEAYPEAVEPSLDAVAAHLETDDGRLRENAAEAVAGVARTRPRAVLPVLDTLADRLSDGDEDEDVRAAAALALARAARSDPLSVALHVDAVRDATADDDDRVATRARSALLSVSGLDAEGALDEPVSARSG
ncbi:HEAT repeat domain-containing protein [Halosimplex salinum]|uniref:HEAT repeat domain-containing protein n=1 Tax=Halosimplex salinum TaxID=1710538 RepID=UPI000F46D7E1|nr:HEAT repeat domain-containing protein [Halosimplex salinum]